MSENTYEDYPLPIFCLTALKALLNYLLGAMIFYIIGGVLLGIAYLVISLLSLLLSMRFRCAYCYYYGKRCSSGLGLLSRFLFKKRDGADFGNPRNVIPVAIASFSILLLPLIAAVIFLLLDFSLALLLLSLTYFVIAFILEFSFRKNLVCRYCKQGEMGCPAYKGMKGKDVS